MDKPKHSLLTGSILSLTKTVYHKTRRCYRGTRFLPGHTVMRLQRLAPDKIQAISFKAVKACYPFTTKGGLFSLLCYQP